MSNALPLTPPGYRDDELPRFEIHNPNEILYLLRGLQASGALISLTPANRSWNVITSILDLDDDQLTLDRAHDEVLNRELLKGTSFTFSANLDHVPVLFVGGDAEEVEFEDRDAIAIPMPESLYRLQRREYFRVHLPLANPVLLRAPAQPDQAIPGFTAPVIDMSMGGLAFTDDSGQLRFGIGTLLEGCRIHLPDIEPVEVALEVRSAIDIPLRNGLSRLRVGCRFARLPNTYAVALQRYIMELEHARRHL